MEALFTLAHYFIAVVLLVSYLVFLWQRSSVDYNTARLTHGIYLVLTVGVVATL